MRRRRKKLTLEDMELANIGEKYHPVSIDKIPDGCAYKGYLEKYCACLDENVQAGVGLLLLGDHDYGKTGAAVCVQKRALIHGFSSLFLEADTIQGLAISKKVFWPDVTWLERAELVDVLVLDDLGLEHTKGFGKALIEGMLRRRCNRRRTTIITSNLDRDHIRKRYGRGVDGLLRESFIEIHVKGKNWRAEISDKLAARFERSKKPPKRSA